MTAIVAETTRGGITESIHHGVVAVANTDGDLVAGWGDPDLVVFFRSSAKPFQAVPLVECGAADAFGFTPPELALACASHSGEPSHRATATRMLAKIGLTEGDLRCGSPPPYDEVAGARTIAGVDPPTPLGCDCSGKHAGMLAACVHLGYPTDSYLDPAHPLQQRIRAVMGEVLRTDPERLPLGVDGCGVPTFAAPVRAFAASYATLAAPERAAPGHGSDHAAALNRLRAAMIAHPENVGGTGMLVTDLMALAGGSLVVKSGAEGLLCVGAAAAGLGIAVRILDGSFRAHAVVIAAVLDQLGLVPPSTVSAFLERHEATIRNHVGVAVGELRPTVRVG